MKRPLIIVCLLFCSSSLIAALGCEDIVAVTLPDLERRARNYIAAANEPLVQDNTLRENWYSVADYAMPTDRTIPDIARCGTYFPVWMQGTLPTEIDGEVVRLACTKGFYDNCDISEEIRVINCDGVFFFYLKPTPINTGYCFDPPALQIPDVPIAPPPTFLPSSVSVQSELQWDEIPSGQRLPQLFFMCNFDTSTNENYLYSVMWYVDDIYLLTLGPKKKQDIADTALKEELLLTKSISLGKTDMLFRGQENSNTLLEVDIKYAEAGYSIKCAVRVRDGDIGMMGNTTFSPGLFAGIQLLTPHLEIERGSLGIIIVRPTVPIGCAWDPAREPNCKLGLAMFDPSTTHDCSKVDIAVAGNYLCGVELFGDSYMDWLDQKRNWNRNFTFTVTTMDGQFYHLDRSIFQLGLRTDKRANDHRIWRSYQLPDIQILVHDTASWRHKYCHANVDPHMRSADGRYYENQNDGEFILYKHKYLHQEVQMKTARCNNNLATCACAVTIRAGGDLYGFILCDGQHPFINFLSCKDGILSVVRRTEFRYEVFLPIGTRVEININRGETYKNTMNVAIYLSKKDEERIEGLCGSFNNNPNDDFVIRHTGAVTQDNNVFSVSWKINALESFLSRSNQNPSTWDIGRLLCVCPNATLAETRSLINSSICSPTESVLCTRNPHQGQDVVKCPFHDSRPTTRSFQEMKRRVKRATRPIQYTGRDSRSIGNISLETAETACVAFFSTSPNYKLQNDLPINTLNNSIHECALDYQMSNGDISWAVPHLQSWTGNIETQISKDKEFQEDHPNITEDFLANACPNQCNNNGRCDNGTCVCDDGYASSDCSIGLMFPPPVNDIYNDGQCDTSTDNCCSGFSIYGDNFIRSESLECRVEETQVDVNGSKISLEPIVQRAEFVSLFELICPVRCNVPSKSTRRPLATIFNFSVSNFGQNFGARQSMFVYDQRCTIMEVNMSFILKPGYCYINGNCYADGEDNPTDSCLACASVISSQDWSPKRSKECSGKDTSIDSAGYAPVGSVFILVLVLFTASFVQFA